MKIGALENDLQLKPIVRYVDYIKAVNTVPPIGGIEPSSSGWYLVVKVGFNQWGEFGEVESFITKSPKDGDGFLNYYVGRSFDKDAYIKHKLAPTTKDIVGFLLLILLK